MKERVCDIVLPCCEARCEFCVPVRCSTAYLHPVQGFVGRALGDPGLKPTVRVGEAAMREVAAYLLDHEHFARVPATALVKVGALNYESNVLLVHRCGAYCRMRACCRHEG